MKRLFIALCATFPALPLAACAGSYGYDEGFYTGGPYAYDGFYDDYYGSIYDGYWGDDGGFYYRRGPHDRHFRRGDPAHFSRMRPANGNFHPIQGSMRPQHGMRMPHFNGGGGGRGEHHPG